MSNFLRPFWRYYGAKWMSAPHYPAPKHATIVEPFAGAAGYSLRYYKRRVILVEAYPVVAGIWRFLIAATPNDVLSIPVVDAVDELPDRVPQEARWLVGMTMNTMAISPNRVTSSGILKRRLESGRICEGWSAEMRDRVASQVGKIKHWRVIEGDYTQAPDVEATWFVDPPYIDKGKHYVHGSTRIDFAALASWCRSRTGQTVVCEASGATWLPFRPLRRQSTTSSLNRGARYTESVWISNEVQQPLWFGAAS